MKRRNDDEFKKIGRAVSVMMVIVVSMVIATAIAAIYAIVKLVNHFAG